MEIITRGYHSVLVAAIIVFIHVGEHWTASCSECSRKSNVVMPRMLTYPIILCYCFSSSHTACCWFRSASACMNERMLPRLLELEYTVHQFRPCSWQHGTPGACLTTANLSINRDVRIWPYHLSLILCTPSKLVYKAMASHLWIKLVAFWTPCQENYTNKKQAS
jgi:hypothetical protein